MQPMEQLLAGAVTRGRTSARERLERWASKRFVVAQCAIAAGLAWIAAHALLGDPHPFFAPIAAVVSLGTSYGQRLRRVFEVSLGVALGVGFGDLLVSWVGSGWWQLTVIVALAMSVALLLDGSQLFVMQAAVQSIVVVTLLPASGAALTRWLDAVVGGGVALVAATVVPAAALRRPRDRAASVADKIAALLRAAAGIMRSGEVEPAFELLAHARSTDSLVSELRAAADEGLSVVVSSPFRARHRSEMRQLSELVEPLDRALRSTRVLVRHVTVAAYRRRAIPASYAALCDDLAAAVDLVAGELRGNRMAVAARPKLLAVAVGTGEVERTPDLTADATLAQIRAVVADLLLLTGMGQIEASDALPPPR